MMGSGTETWGPREEWAQLPAQALLSFADARTEEYVPESRLIADIGGAAGPLPPDCGWETVPLAQEGPQDAWHLPYGPGHFAHSVLRLPELAVGNALAEARRVTQKNGLVLVCTRVRPDAVFPGTTSATGTTGTERDRMDRTLRRYGIVPRCFLHDGDEGNAGKVPWNEKGKMIIVGCAAP